jgi:hypothetical protein
MVVCALKNFDKNTNDLKVPKLSEINYINKINNILKKIRNLELGEELSLEADKILRPLFNQKERLDCYKNKIIDRYSDVYKALDQIKFLLNNKMSHINEQNKISENLNSEDNWVNKILIKLNNKININYQLPSIVFSTFGGDIGKLYDLLPIA